MGSSTSMKTNSRSVGEQGWRVRALGFRQCLSGSHPGLGLVSGLSLLVLYSVPGGFFLGYSVFALSRKTNIGLTNYLVLCVFQDVLKRIVRLDA